MLSNLLYSVVMHLIFGNQKYLAKKIKNFRFQTKSYLRAEIID